SSRRRPSSVHCRRFWSRLAPPAPSPDTTGIRNSPSSSLGGTTDGGESCVLVGGVISLSGYGRDTEPPGRAHHLCPCDVERECGQPAVAASQQPAVPRRSPPESRRWTLWESPRPRGAAPLGAGAGAPSRRCRRA